MVRSSRGNRRLACTLGVAAIIFAAAGGVSAHRLDEYLQAARFAIDPDRVELELDLTPGVALAAAIIADVDRNRDGHLSPAEQQAYQRAVSEALDLDVDGTPLPMQAGAPNFPSTDAIARGEGTIRLRFTTQLPPLRAGAHHLSFRNRHHPDGSVYLANALVPESSLIAISAQRRDLDQTQLTIDYELRPAWATSASVWLLVGLAVMVLFVLVRRGQPAAAS